MTREETGKAFVQAMKGTPWIGEQVNADLTIWTPPADAPLHRHMEFVGRVAEAIAHHTPDKVPGFFFDILWRSTNGLVGDMSRDWSWSAMLAALAAKGAKP